MAVPVAVAGVVISALGALQTAETQSATAKYNQQVSTVQSQEAENQASAQATQVQQQTKQQEGQVASAYAAGGVDVDEGTPLNVMASTAAQGELARQLTLYGGDVQGLAKTQQAGLYGVQANQAAIAGPIAAGSTILTGAGKIITRNANPSGGGNSPLSTP